MTLTRGTPPCTPHIEVPPPGSPLPCSVFAGEIGHRRLSGPLAIQIAAASPKLGFVTFHWEITQTNPLKKARKGFDKVWHSRY